MARRRLILIPVLVSLALAGAALAAQAPVAVSPGDATKVALIRDDCPTFSWGEVEGAKSYDLVVYRLGEQNEDEEPVLRRSFPGSVDGWTPALDQCLERGGRYAWSVRAVGGKEASEWSELSLFEVASGPSEEEFEEALQVVRKYLGEETTGSANASAEGASAGVSATIVTPSAGGATTGPSPLAPAVGDSALQVNGSPVVTVATMAGALCSSLDLRYLDQGDGTVLDCNTGLIWLKDANCFDSRQWVQAEADAAGLADGVCGLTDGSSPGDWRQPTIQEFCSAWSGSDLFPCPSGAASDSLIDSSVGPPTVVNARGDGVWSPGDAFVGVTTGLLYWSSTTVGSNAWDVWLLDGSVGNVDKNFYRVVWPVRSGQ